MAKSNNTTNPSTPNRRSLLAGGAALWLTPATLPPLSLPSADTDPVLVLWCDWHKRFVEAEAQTAAWERLHEQLLDTIGAPKVTVPIPGGAPVEASDGEAIDALLGTAPETQALRANLHADLAAHRARWEEAAAALHYDEMDKRQDAAHQHAEAMIDPLFAAPAATLAGVAAKLTFILIFGPLWQDEEEFPWPQLRSALADLLRLTNLPPLLPAAVS